MENTRTIGMDATRRYTEPLGRPADRSGTRPDRFDPAHLEALGNLDLVARGVVEGFLIGLHRSPHRGFSVEFAENRAYTRGDDLRFVDWRLFARSNRYFVKQYEEETNLRAWLLFDVSRSMEWTSDADRIVTKLQYARMTAAALSHLLVRQGDAVGLVAFDETIRVRLAPGSTRAHLASLLGELQRVRGNGTTDAAGALREAALRMRGRGLVVLLSDLLVDEEQTMRSLHFLRHRGHQVMVLHIMDPAERDLPQAGDAVYFDPEDLGEIRTDSAGIRPLYRRAVREALGRWRAECRRMGADYHLFITDAPLGIVLREFLRKRARLG